MSAYKTQVSFLLMASFAIFFAFLFYSDHLANHTTEVNESYVEEMELALKREHLLSEVKEEFGFSNFIHNFKNYVIRRDETYLERARSNASQIITYLSELKANSDDRELTAIKDIEETLKNYRDMLLIISANPDMEVTVLDGLVKVDDTKATEAFGILTESIQKAADAARAENQEQLSVLIRDMSFSWFLVAAMFLQVVGVAYFYRKQGQLADDLKQSLNYNQRLIDSSPVALLIVDSKGVVKEANKASEALFKGAKEKIVGLKVEQFLPERFREHHIELREQHAQSNKPILMNERRDLVAQQMSGNEINVEIGINRVDFEDDCYFIVGLMDVTEQRLIEQGKMQKNKLESVGQLSAGLAHDFNNILSIISGNVELMLSKNNVEERTQKKLLDIEKAVERGSDLTRRLMGFSKHEPRAMEVVQVDGALGDCTELAKRTLNSDISLCVDLDSDLWPVKSEKSQLENAIINLCINSAHAMPDGGSLSIVARNEDLAGDDICYLGENIEGKFVTIKIEDTGTGIESDLLDKIFEPFFSTKDKDQGTGLGLSMVLEFVRNSRGHLQVSSTVSQGTIFKLFLPAHLSQSETEI